MAIPVQRSSVKKTLSSLTCQSSPLVISGPVPWKAVDPFIEQFQWLVAREESVDRRNTWHA
jgi:hypothetical protein